MVEVTGEAGRYRVIIGDQDWEVDARLSAQGICSLLVDGRSYVVPGGRPRGDLRGGGGGRALYHRRRGGDAPRHPHAGRRDQGRGRPARCGRPCPAGSPTSPCRVGRPGGPGDTLVVVEAMKMENELKASGRGDGPRGPGAGGPAGQRRRRSRGHRVSMAPADSGHPLHRASTSTSGRSTCCATSTWRSRRGRWWWCAGPSGSGKSTLIRCVNGLEGVQEGEITVLGETGHRPAR